MVKYLNILFLVISLIGCKERDTGSQPFDTNADIKNQGEYDWDQWYYFTVNKRTVKASYLLDSMRAHVGYSEYFKHLKNDNELNLYENCFQLVVYSESSEDRSPRDQKRLKIVYAGVMDPEGNYCDFDKPAFALAILEETEQSENYEDHLSAE